MYASILTLSCSIVTVHKDEGVGANGRVKEIQTLCHIDVSVDIYE